MLSGSQLTVAESQLQVVRSGGRSGGSNGPTNSSPSTAEFQTRNEKYPTSDHKNISRSFDAIHFFLRAPFVL